MQQNGGAAVRTAEQFEHLLANLNIMPNFLCLIFSTEGNKTSGLNKPLPTGVGMTRKEVLQEKQNLEHYTCSSFHVNTKRTMVQKQKQLD